MHAVIKVGSHQYDVQMGSRVLMEKLDAPVGSEVTFEEILLLGEGESIKLGDKASGKVVGMIKEHRKGPKIDVYHRRRRKGFHKKQGHRQNYTVVEITKVEA